MNFFITNIKKHSLLEIYNKVNEMYHNATIIVSIKDGRNAIDLGENRTVYVYKRYRHDTNKTAVYMTEKELFGSW